MEKRLDYTKYKITACMKRPIYVPQFANQSQTCSNLKVSKKGKAQFELSIPPILKTSLRRELSNLFATTVKISCVTPPETKMLGR